jgi:hypothetical protein
MMLDSASGKCKAHAFLDGWDDLYSGGAVAKYGHSLPRILEVFGPVGTMNKVAFETVNAIDFGPFPFTVSISEE